jgi:hypothetical protein
MEIKNALKMFFQRRPGNPPDGKGLIYFDRETGKPVWQDKNGVHFFCACESGTSTPPEPPAETSIAVSPASGTLPVSTGTLPVTVTSAGSGWSASNVPSWISLSQTSGDEGQTALTLTYTANPGTSVRNAIITFIHANGSLSATCSVTQSGLVSIEMYPNDLSLPNTSGEVDIEITSYNGGWSVDDLPEWVVNDFPEWISLSQRSGDTGQTALTLSYETNPGTSARNANIAFRHVTNAVVVYLPVTQAAGASTSEPEPKSVSLGYYSKDISAGNASTNMEYLLSVMSVGGGWTLKSKPDWVYLSQTSGSGSGTYGNSITVGVLANSGASERSGAVVFWHALDATVTATLSITQAVAI